MLFSNISMWELNCYKWKGRPVITTLKWKMYGRMLFTYFISHNNWRLSCKKGVYGQFHVTDITGQIFGTKTFPLCLKFVQVFITWYQQKRNSDCILKSCQYFCFKLCYGHYKTRVTRHSGSWINDIKYCRSWIFLQIIYLPYTLTYRNAGWWDSVHFTNKHQVSFSSYFKCDRIMYVLVTFSKEDTFNNNNYNN